MPTDQTKLFQKIEQYKQELTLPHHKRAVQAWEKSVRGMIVRADVAKMDGIKELIKQLKERILQCNLVLQNTRDLPERERDILFTRKEEQLWLVSFFEDAERIVEDAPAKIDKKLKELKG